MEYQPQGIALTRTHGRHTVPMLCPGPTAQTCHGALIHGNDGRIPLAQGNDLHPGLHARTLLMPHPEGGTLEVSAAPPPHFEATMKFFGFDNPAPAKPRRHK